MTILAENWRMRTGMVRFVLVLCAVSMLAGWSGAAEGVEPQISAGQSHTVGLNTDGTVVAAGYDLSDWTDIVQISAGSSHTVGLKTDGTVVSSGRDSSTQRNVSGWTDIVQVSAGIGHTVGLKTDGTVVAVGSNSSGRLDVSGWTDIVDVVAGGFIRLVLKRTVRW